MTDPAELDDEIKARVAGQVAERAQRRERLRRVRAEFDERRAYGKATAQRQKLQRLREEDQS